MKLIYFFTFFFSLIFWKSACNVYAQKKAIKLPPGTTIISVREELKELEGQQGILNDSLRLELINKLAALYMKTSKDSALYYAQSALENAKKLGLNNVTAVSLYNIASIHEHYKEIQTAEKIYLEWMEVRKGQNDDEYRWALHEMRKFYCTTRQEEKLEKIEQEWLAVLDRQLDQKHKSPWFDWEDGTPEESYYYSMEPVFVYLISNKYYFIAERSFKHTLEKCPECSDQGRGINSIYGNGERMMLWDSDTTSLVKWYGLWYDALEKYGNGKDETIKTLNRIAQQYTSGYFKYDRYFGRFYPLMLNYAAKTGGDKAVHDILVTSSERYVSSMTVRINLNLSLMLSCIRMGDKERLDKVYSQTDKLIEQYISKKGSKYDLLMWLVQAKRMTKDKEFVKWCDKSIKKLE